MLTYPSLLSSPIPRPLSAASSSSSPSSPSSPVFVHLHTHSTYSDGLASPLQLARQASLLGFTALALTDHTTLSGHSAFINACALYHLSPILGVELRVHTAWGFGHNVVLTRSEGEYHYLQWLLRRHKKVQLGDLKGAGLITSGCLGGVVAQAIARQDTWKALDVVHAYHDLLGEDYVLEAQPTFYRVLPWILSFARNLHIPVVTTNDVHYLTSEDSYRHVNAGLHLATEDEMRLRCSFTEYQMGITYTQTLANQCQWIQEEGESHHVA